MSLLTYVELGITLRALAEDVLLFCYFLAHIPSGISTGCSISAAVGRADCIAADAESSSSGDGERHDGRHRAVDVLEIEAEVVL